LGKHGGEEKNVPKKKHLGLRKENKMGQLEFTTLVSPRTRRDEKGASISAPSIHIGALVVVGSLWPKSSTLKMDSKQSKECVTLWPCYLHLKVF
jgi:hypothetical protein